MLFRTPELAPKELEVVQEIERLRGITSYSIGQPRRWFGLLRRSTFAKAVRGSNTIEGYHVTMDDALAAVEGEEPIDPKDAAWMAVSGYRAAMTFVLQKAEDQFFSFSPELLKSLHFMMIGYDLTKNPGRWRPGPIFVRDESTGVQVYEGPPMEMVAPLIDELLIELNAPDLRGVPNVVRGAMAHLNLVMIHPFSDGNGRMGRCLQTLVLARSGVVAPLFSSIEEYLGRNTRAYYDVLAEVGEGAWHPEHDTRPWIRFCLTAHFRQAMTLLRRIREIQKISDELEDIVRRLGLPERSVLALTDAALGYKVRNPTYRSASDVTDTVAGRDLRALAKAGLLEPKGEKRGRFYIAAPPVSAIRKKAAEPKLIRDPFEEPKPGDPDMGPSSIEPVLPGMDEFVQ
jgi:Fic family protein